MKNSRFVAIKMWHMRYSWAACLGLLLVAASVFHASKTDDGLQAAAAGLSGMRDIIYINTRLNENILKSRFNLLHNYDPIAADVAEGSRIAASPWVRDLPSDDAARAIFAAFAGRIERIERFKRTNAVYQNSSTYLPEAINLAKGATGSADLQHDLDRLLVQSLLYSASLSATAAGRSSGALAAIRAKYPEEATKAALKAVLSHAAVVDGRQAALNQLVRAIVDDGFVVQAAAVLDFYLERHQAMVARFRLAMLLMRICGVSLLGVLLLQARHLARAKAALLALNASLEERVESRTKTVESQRALLMNSERLASLGEMAAGVAHEINNPLAVIHARARRSRAKFAHEPAAVSAFAEIEQVAMRIAAIVKGLRSLSRDASDDPFVPSDVAAVIGDAVELCREKIKFAGIELREQPLPAGCMVAGRSAQLSQVILNLLSNAADALGETTPRPADAWIEVSAAIAGDDVEIRVTDSGLGIPAAVAAKIMQPFFTTKPVGKGTGLGLSISHGIISSHGGNLFVDAKALNTSFVVKLPLLHQVAEAPGIAA